MEALDPSMIVDFLVVCCQILIACCIYLAASYLGWCMASLHSRGRDGRAPLRQRTRAVRTRQLPRGFY
jgi:hypothetical protein